MDKEIKQLLEEIWNFLDMIYVKESHEDTKQALMDRIESVLNK
jgi:hypothetical protein